MIFFFQVPKHILCFSLFILRFVLTYKFPSVARNHLIFFRVKKKSRIVSLILIYKIQNGISIWRIVVLY